MSITGLMKRETSGVVSSFALFLLNVSLLAFFPDLQPVFLINRQTFLTHLMNEPKHLDKFL